MQALLEFQSNGISDLAVGRGRSPSSCSTVRREDIGWRRLGKTAISQATYARSKVGLMPGRRSKWLSNVTLAHGRSSESASID